MSIGVHGSPTATQLSTTPHTYNYTVSGPIDRVMAVLFSGLEDPSETYGTPTVAGNSMAPMGGEPARQASALGRAWYFFLGSLDTNDSPVAFSLPTGGDISIGFLWPLLVVDAASGAPEDSDNALSATSDTSITLEGASEGSFIVSAIINEAGSAAMDWVPDWEQFDSGFGGCRGSGAYGIASGGDTIAVSSTNQNDQVQIAASIAEDTGAGGGGGGGETVPDPKLQNLERGHGPAQAASLGGVLALHDPPGFRRKSRIFVPERYAA